MKPSTFSLRLVHRPATSRRILVTGIPLELLFYEIWSYYISNFVCTCWITFSGDVCTDTTLQSSGKRKLRNGAAVYGLLERHSCYCRGYHCISMRRKRRERYHFDSEWRSVETSSGY